MDGTGYCSVNYISVCVRVCGWVGWGENFYFKPFFKVVVVKLIVISCSKKLISLYFKLTLVCLLNVMPIMITLFCFHTSPG
jgi:hypothetical protein